MWTYQYESDDVQKLCSEMFRLLIKLLTTDRHVLWISPRFFRFVTVIIRGRYLAGWCGVWYLKTFPSGMKEIRYSYYYFVGHEN